MYRQYNRKRPIRGFVEASGSQSHQWLYCASIAKVSWKCYHHSYHGLSAKKLLFRPLSGHHQFSMAPRRIIARPSAAMRHDKHAANCSHMTYGRVTGGSSQYAHRGSDKYYSSSNSTYDIIHMYVINVSTMLVAIIKTFTLLARGAIVHFQWLSSIIMYRRLK